MAAAVPFLYENAAAHSRKEGSNGQIQRMESTSFEYTVEVEDGWYRNKMLHSRDSFSFHHPAANKEGFVMGTSRGNATCRVDDTGLCVGDY